MTNMVLRDISFEKPEDNLLFDEWMLWHAQKEQGPETLRFWEAPSYFVVLGRAGSVEEDVYLKHAQEDVIPVLHRASGGGTVVQGKGCLNFALVLHKDRDPAVADLSKSYQYISERVIAALNVLGVQAQFYPISDIALKDSHKKFSGNAQKRMKHYILHHGTILYDFDLNMISRYLKMPQSIPDYRAQRDHKDFVTNIAIDPDMFKQEMKRQWNVLGDHQPLNDKELASFKAFC